MVALDIFIGLVLIYFLYSLLVSILAEMISTSIGMRARMLRQGIDNLLNDKQPTPGYSVDFIKWLKDIFLVEPSDFKYSNGGRFFKEPSIKYMAKPGENFLLSTRNTKPAYISKENFTHTILNMVSQRSQGINEWDKIKFAIKHNAMALEPETLKMFQDWVARSNDSYGNFITNIERTFEEMMDRVNGWYKRKIHLFLGVLGFILCLIMNVDTFQIVKILLDNPERRSELVGVAISTAESYKHLMDTSTPIKNKEEIEKHLSSLKETKKTIMASLEKSNDILAMGWDFPCWAQNSGFKILYVITCLNPFSSKLWGILISTLALGLGAPFWYDLLKKLVAIRGAGVKPEERDQKLKEELGIKKNGNDGLAPLTKDPVEIAIAENRDYWESLPGFISVNDRIDKALRTKYIQLVFMKDYSPFEISTVKVNDKQIIVKTIEADKASLSTFSQKELNELPIGALIHKVSNSWGTPSGILFDRRLNKRVLLTCGHLLRTGKNIFFDPDNTVIHLKKEQDSIVELGRVKNIVMSSFCDAGIIEINSIFENEIFNKYKILNTFREILSDDNESTIVKIYKLQEGRKFIDPEYKPQLGKVIRSKEYQTFDDNGINVRYFELILVGDENFKGIKITDHGDSGALVCDNHDTPIGIVIGGAEIDKFNYTYVLKMKDILDILQLQLI